MSPNQRRREMISWVHQSCASSSSFSSGESDPSRGAQSLFFLFTSWTGLLLVSLPTTSRPHALLNVRTGMEHIVPISCTPAAWVPSRQDSKPRRRSNGLPPEEFSAPTAHPRLPGFLLRNLRFRLIPIRPCVHASGYSDQGKAEQSHEGPGRGMRVGE